MWRADKADSTSALPRIILWIALLAFPGCEAQIIAPNGTYAYKQAAGLNLKLDVYRAGADDTRVGIHAKVGDGLRPVLLWIHGGALIWGNRIQMPQDILRLLLEAGYIVVSLDYRLAPETKLPEIVKDTYDALTWISNNGEATFGADTKRIGVIGQSAGGYLSLMAGLHPTVRPKALVSLYGYGDVGAEWYAIPPAWVLRETRIDEKDAFASVSPLPVANDDFRLERRRFYIYARQTGTWRQRVTGRDPAVDLGFFSSYSPIENVTPAYPPTFLAHGENDNDVPHYESVDMATTLERSGVVHQFITVKNGEHAFDIKNNGLKHPATRFVYRHMLTFLGEHL
jgi:acetyl esterase/lipase